MTPTIILKELCFRFINYLDEKGRNNPNIGCTVEYLEDRSNCYNHIHLGHV